jgi:hypothetical protein
VVIVEWAWVELNYRPHAYRAGLCASEYGLEVLTSLPFTNILLSMSRIQEHLAPSTNSHRASRITSTKARPSGASTTLLILERRESVGHFAHLNGVTQKGKAGMTTRAAPFSPRGAPQKARAFGTRLILIPSSRLSLLPSLRP